MSKVPGFRIKAALAGAAGKQLMALGHHATVSTTFTGKTAFTGYETYADNGEAWKALINYPALSDNAPLTRIEADIFAAYTLHEIGHVAFSASGQTMKYVFGGNLQKQLWNGLEDPRIENSVVMAGIGGARKAFKSLLRLLTSDIGEAWNPTNINHAPFTLALLGRLAYGNKNAFTVGLLDRIPEPKRSLYAAAMTAVLATDSGRSGSKQVLEITNKFLADWRALEPAQEPVPPTEPEDEESDDEESDDEPDNSDGDPADEDGNEPDDESGDSDGDEFDDEYGDGEADGDDDGFDDEDDAPDFDESGSDVDMSGDLPQVDDDGEDDDEDGDGIPQKGENFEDSAAEESDAEIMDPSLALEEIAARINARSKVQEKMPSTIPCSWSDASKWHWKGVSAKANKGRVKKLSNIQFGALKAQLARMLRAPEVCGWDGGMASGRFDARMSSRMMAGAENVFKKRWVTEGVNTAVTVLVDLSGSMKGEPADVAAKVAYAIADAAEQSMATVQVLGFRSDTRGSWAGATDQFGKTVSVQYDVPENAQLSIWKKFDQKLALAAPTMTNMKYAAKGGTPDYPALKACVEQMAMRPEPRRLVIVLTDGIGDGELVRNLSDYADKAMGVDVVGIGIGIGFGYQFQTNPSQHLDQCEKSFRVVYPNGAAAPDLETLASVALRKLNATLDKRLAGRRTM